MESKDNTDVIIVSATVGLAFALAIVLLVRFTNVWIASLAVLALPVITLAITLVSAVAIIGLRQRWAVRAKQPARQALLQRIEHTSEAYVRAWLRKHKDFGHASACSIDAECPPGHVCVDGSCQPA